MAHFEKLSFVVEVTFNFMSFSRSFFIIDIGQVYGFLMISTGIEVNLNSEVA